MNRRNATGAPTGTDDDAHQQQGAEDAVPDGVVADEVAAQRIDISISGASRIGMKRNHAGKQVIEAFAGQARILVPQRRVVEMHEDALEDALCQGREIRQRELRRVADDAA